MSVFCDTSGRITDLCWYATYSTCTCYHRLLLLPPLPFSVQWSNNWFKMEQSTQSCSLLLFTGFINKIHEIGVASYFYAHSICLTQKQRDLCLLGLFFFCMESHHKSEAMMRASRRWNECLNESTLEDDILHSSSFSCFDFSLFYLNLAVFSFIWKFNTTSVIFWNWTLIKSINRPQDFSY